MLKYHLHLANPASRWLSISTLATLVVLAAVTLTLGLTTSLHPCSILQTKETSKTRFQEYGMSVEDSIDGNAAIRLLLQSLEHRRTSRSNHTLLELIVNPFLPIFLCDYHFGVTDLPRTPVRIVSLDPFNLHTISRHDIVCCQWDALATFSKNILPSLPRPIILFTHKWNLPQVELSELSNKILSDPMIAHWISQNPIYGNNEKYGGFPYGIREANLEAYAESLLLNNDTVKNTTIEHLKVSVTHPSRSVLPQRPSMSLKPYYERIMSSQFLVSSRGDRPDTYRHWEALGLGTIPVANIEEAYFSQLFGSFTLYVNDTVD